jgi:hypothetical protein
MRLEKFKEDWLKQIVLDKVLRAGALRLCIAISTHMNRKHGGWAWPGFATLARETGMCRRWISDLIRLLEERGHLKVNRSRVAYGKNGVNHYKPILKSLTTPSELATSPPSEAATSLPSELATSPEPLNEPLREPLNKPKRENFRENGFHPIGRPIQERGAVRTGGGSNFDARLCAIGSGRPQISKLPPSGSLGEACDRLRASMRASKDSRLRGKGQN